MPAGTHLWAGNHTYRNNVLSAPCLPTARSRAVHCQVLPSMRQAVLARATLSNCSFSCEAFEKPQLLPGVEPCQGHQSVLVTHTTHNLVASCSKHYIIWASSISFWNISRTNPQDQPPLQLPDNPAPFFTDTDLDGTDCGAYGCPQVNKNWTVWFTDTDRSSS